MVVTSTSKIKEGVLTDFPCVSLPLPSRRLLSRSRPWTGRTDTYRLRRIEIEDKGRGKGGGEGRGLARPLPLPPKTFTRVGDDLRSRTGKPHVYPPLPPKVWGLRGQGTVCGGVGGGVEAISGRWPRTP